MCNKTKIFATFAIAVLALVSCRKESNVSPAASSNKEDKNIKTLRREAKPELSSIVSKSQYGFLVLKDSASLTAYTHFIDSNETSDVEAFLESIGFESQASLGDKSDNYIVPSASNSEYMFNKSGIVQIGDVVVRGVSSKGYLLAMPIANLDENSYANLRDGKFDANTMCRLQIGKQYENVLEYIQGNVGLDDAGTGNDNPHPVQFRKLFGWETTTTTTPTSTTTTTVYWFFGMKLIVYETTVNYP